MLNLKLAELPDLRLCRSNNIKNQRGKVVIIQRKENQNQKYDKKKTWSWLCRVRLRIN